MLRRRMASGKTVPSMGRNLSFVFCLLFGNFDFIFSAPLSVDLDAEMLPGSGVYWRRGKDERK